MTNSHIAERVKTLLSQIPEGVVLEAAAKTRTPEEVRVAIEAGITVIGENYLQDAEPALAALGRRARWHFIGHLQRNKVKQAVGLFDMIETVDSPGLLAEINRRAAHAGKVFPVLVEVNSAREPQKSGVLPEAVVPLLEGLAGLDNVRVMGLMTMGPLTADPEQVRPYLAATYRLYRGIGAMSLPGVEMRWLSMGMSDTYRVAIEEGANMVRIGSGIFGPRAPRR